MSDDNLNNNGQNDNSNAENSENENYPLMPQNDSVNSTETSNGEDTDNAQSVSSDSDEQKINENTLGSETNEGVSENTDEDFQNQQENPHNRPNNEQYENPQNYNAQNGHPYDSQQSSEDNRQYENPQNPYSPYGQYNPYGKYRNPYEDFNNPYSQGQNQQYWSYQQYGNQNQQQNQPNMPTEPPKKSKGLKVFLWTLGTLIGVFVIGFCGYGIYSAVNQPLKMPEITNSQPSDNGGTVSKQPKVEGKAPGNGTNPNSGGITINQKPAGNELSAKDVYKKVVESVVGVETTVPGTAQNQTGIIQGTGIVASSNGYLLTNAHVVNYSRDNKVKIIFHNNKQYEATVVGFDKTSDLAVLKIKANNLKPAEFGSAEQLEIGDHVIAIGNPGGLSYSSSLTGGYVSALNRAIESHSDNGMTYIQTDAAINPGNSGGPLVNMYGQVIGINSNKIVATGYEGMGFAIPVSRAKRIIDDLIARGYVSGRSRLGVTVSDISEIQSQLSGYPQGVMIREISAESDLNKSNVAVGDVITKADGKEIRGMDDLFSVLNTHKAGDTITLTVFRMGTTKDNSVTRDVKTKLLEDKGETQK